MSQNTTLSCARSKTLTRSIWSFDSGKLSIYTVSLIQKNEKKKKKTLFKEETIFATEHYFYSLSKSAKSNVPFYVYTYENIVLSINSLRKKPTARPYADSHLPQSKEFWGTNYVVGKLQVFSVDKSSIPGASSLPPREIFFFFFVVPNCFQNQQR